MALVPPPHHLRFTTEQFLSTHSKQLRRFVQIAALLTGVALCLAPCESLAKAQVSDRFIELARLVGKRFAVELLKDACGTKPNALCSAAADAIAELVELALSGNIDRRSIERLGIALANQLARAALLDAGDRGLGAAIDEPLLANAPKPGPICKAAIANLRTTLIGCGQEVVLPGRKPERPACDSLIALTETTAAGCGFSTKVTIPKDKPAPAVARAIAAWIREKRTDKEPLESNAPYLLDRLADLMDNPPRDGAFGVAMRFFEHAESLSEYFDNMSSHTSFVSYSAAENGTDKVAASTLGKADAWWERGRRQAHVKLALALAMGVDPNEEAMGDILASFPRVGNFPIRTASLRRDMALMRRVDQFAWWGVLSALVIDYFQTRDSIALREHATDVGLLVLARAMALGDKGGVECTGVDPARRKYACEEFGAEGVARQKFEIELPGTEDADEMALRTLEARASIPASKATCTWQAAALALGRFGAATDPVYCRTDPLVAELLGPLGLPLVPVAGTDRLMEWNVLRRAELLYQPSVLGEAFRARALAFAARVLAGARKRLPPPSGREQGELDVVLATFEQAWDGAKGRDPTGTARAVLATGAAMLWPKVEALLETKIAAKATCKQASGGSGTGATAEDSNKPGPCIIRALAEALYTPTVDFLAEPDPERRRELDLTGDLVKELSRVDPLGTSPLLLNVGLGGTATVDLDGVAGGHMTVIEKVGWAFCRFGERNQGEVGLFVGGFLDPIVRSLAGADDEVPRWLAGFAVGTREIDKKWPVGLELHLAVAPPIRFNADPVSAAGLTLLVPLDLAFTE